MQILIERFLGPAAATTAAEKKFLSNIFFEKNFENRIFSCRPTLLTRCLGLFIIHLDFLWLTNKKKYIQNIQKP